MADAVHELRDLDSVTRAVHANSANLAGGTLEAKIIFDPGLN